MARGHPVVARILDPAMAVFEPVRARLLPLATGRVLEIGVGTGLNLRHYRDVREVVGVEPDPYMLERARPRAEAAPFPVALHEASAEALPFDDASFDSAVATWVLCTIPDPVAAARELRRVIKPGGLLVFAEHTVSPHAPWRCLQRAADPVWRRVAGGCHLTRDGVRILRDAGFDLDVRPPRNTWAAPIPTYRGTGRPT